MASLVHRELHSEDIIVEVASGARALEIARSSGVRVALLDAQMPGVNGIEISQKLTAENVQCRCLVTTSTPSSDQLRATLRAGAFGLIPKSSTGRELIEAIRQTDEGRPFLPSSISEYVQIAIRSAEGADHAHRSKLTGREREVLRLIADGFSTSTIAQMLGITEKTAATHRTNLMTKLDLHKVALLVRYAVREGMVDP